LDWTRQQEHWRRMGVEWTEHVGLAYLTEGYGWGKLMKERSTE